MKYRVQKRETSGAMRGSMHVMKNKKTVTPCEEYEKEDPFEITNSEMKGNKTEIDSDKKTFLYEIDSDFFP